MVSEEEYEAHRTVSGLTLDQYLAEVNDTYDKAETSFVVHALNGLCINADLAVKRPSAFYHNLNLPVSLILIRYVVKLKLIKISVNHCMMISMLMIHLMLCLVH